MAEPISSVHDSRIEEFVRLLGENQHRIFVYLMSMMRDRAAVEDVQQETNLVLWREFGSFEPNSNFAAWSCRVAFNQMRAWRKKQQRDRLVFSDSFLEALSAELDSRADDLDRRLIALEKCLERLPEHWAHVQRRALGRKGVSKHVCICLSGYLAVGALAWAVKKLELTPYLDESFLFP